MKEITMQKSIHSMPSFMKIRRGYVKMYMYLLISAKDIWEG